MTTKQGVHGSGSRRKSRFLCGSTFHGGDMVTLKMEDIRGKTSISEIALKALH